MREIAGVLCDLDGTLIDSEPFHQEAWNILVAQHGHTPEPDWNRDCIGLPDIHACNKARALYPKLQDIPDLLEQKQATFRDLVRKQGKALVFPGVFEKLEELTAAGVKLAVGTNSILKNTRLCLEATELLRYFPVVVTMDMVKNGKPHPDIYATAAERLGLPPERCAVLEDATAGIEAGKAAGCLVLGILNSWPAEVMSRADRLFDNTPAAMGWALANRIMHA